MRHGAPGAFLAMPLTLFVAVMFDTFPGTRWLASLMGMSNLAEDTPTFTADVGDSPT